MPDISVIICCYNSQERIGKTIKCLSEQIVSPNISWEIIIVNNNSNDNTSEEALKVWSQLNCNVPFIVINEPKPGLSEARESGIQKSNSDLIIFCDDDNRLFNNYIQRSYEVMKADPKIGALGGQGFADYEITPPSYIQKYAHQYAIGPQAEKSGDITKTKGYVFGAGIVIRKSYYNFIKSNGFKFTLTGRKGNILTSGEDFEMCSAFILAGYKIWYDSELKFFHYLPANRLTWNYLKRMNQGFGYSLAFLLPYMTLTNKKGKFTLKYSYYYFLIKYFVKQLPFRFNLINLFKKSDERLEWERSKYVLVSLLKNSKDIKHLISDLPNRKFTK